MQRPDINLDAVDADGCTALWAAAYNGEYHCALWILSKGPNLELRGKASNTASCTPCNAARSQRPAGSWLRCCRYCEASLRFWCLARAEKL